jgi:hypothetical protein
VWCSRLETSGSKVCNLVLGPADGRVHLVAHLEDAVERLWVMRDKNDALQSSTTRARGLVLGWSIDMPSLVVALSPVRGVG